MARPAGGAVPPSARRALAEQLYPALLPRAHQFFFLGPLAGIFDRLTAATSGCSSRRSGASTRPSHTWPTPRRGCAVGPRSISRAFATSLPARCWRAWPGRRERAARCSSRLARSRRSSMSRACCSSFRPAPRSRLRGRRDAARPAPSGESDEAPLLAASRGRLLDDCMGRAHAAPARQPGPAGARTLVTSPGQEFHVLQLVSPGDEVADAGDAGTVLDEEAVQSYRRRLLDLREELDEAEGLPTRAVADAPRGGDRLPDPGAGARCRPRRARSAAPVPRPSGRARRCKSGYAPPFSASKKAFPNSAGTLTRRSAPDFLRVFAAWPSAQAPSLILMSVESPRRCSVCRAMPVADCGPWRTQPSR